MICLVSATVFALVSCAYQISFGFGVLGTKEFPNWLNDSPPSPLLFLVAAAITWLWWFGRPASRWLGILPSVDGWTFAVTGRLPELILLLKLDGEDFFGRTLRHEMDRRFEYPEKLWSKVHRKCCLLCFYLNKLNNFQMINLER